MNTLAHKPLSSIITTALLLLLACAPYDRMVTLSKNSQAVATGVAIIDAGNYPALTAFQKLKQLPGYRLESRQTTRSGTAVYTALTTETHDAQGNTQFTIQSLSGQPENLLTVQGRTYLYQPQYNGWVDVTGTASQYTPPGQNMIPLQWLAQIGGVPIEAGPEAVQGRAATRYGLQYVITDIAQALGHLQHGAANTLQGTLWVDNQTGALLKAEFLLFENNSRQPLLEFSMEVSQIGQIAPITMPVPVVDPGLMVTATAHAQAWATAQAWRLTPVTLNYQGQPVTFEISPNQISPTTAANLAKASLVLHHVPQELLTNTQQTEFLTLLGTLLTLSIPQSNLVISSTHFQVEAVNPTEQTITVAYFFEVDLQDFKNVELILASAGNPIIMPVAVEP